MEGQQRIDVRLPTQLKKNLRCILILRGKSLTSWVKEMAEDEIRQYHERIQENQRANSAEIKSAVS